MISDLKSLNKELTKWRKKVGDSRIDEGDSKLTREWCLKTLGFSDKLIPTKLIEFIDRKGLNVRYKKKFEEDKQPGKRSSIPSKIEIDILYSFQKGFVHRHLTRLQYYRGDLSQKLHRNGHVLGICEKAVSDMKDKVE